MNLVDCDKCGEIMRPFCEKCTSPLVVWLLTSGSGLDGDEWSVHSIYATEQEALAAKVEHEHLRSRPDGSTYHYDANIEEWPIRGEKK